MTQVWMVRYDSGLYLFSHIDVVEASIRDMYPTDYHIEKEVISDQQHVYQIMHNGKVQDRVAAAVYDVHQYPTTIHRFVTEQDVPKERSKRVDF